MQRAIGRVQQTCIPDILLLGASLDSANDAVVGIVSVFAAPKPGKSLSLTDFRRRVPQDQAYAQIMPDPAPKHKNRYEND